MTSKRTTHPIISHMKKKRIDMGMSLEKLGSRSGYLPSHIWCMENGTINAKIQMISDVAEVLGFDIVLRPK